MNDTITDTEATRSATEYLRGFTEGRLSGKIELADALGKLLDKGEVIRMTDIIRIAFENEKTVSL